MDWGRRVIKKSPQKKQDQNHKKNCPRGLWLTPICKLCTATLLMLESVHSNRDINYSVFLQCFDNSIEGQSFRYTVVPQFIPFVTTFTTKSVKR